MESIRLASEKDIDALLALQAAWPSLPRWTRKHLESELSGELGRLIVAEENGDLIGFAALRLIPPEGEVTIVAVDSKRLRRGIARRMLETLHGLATVAGCEIVGLEVSAANEAAISLYTGMGYRVVGRRTKYYPDGSDALLMSRRG